MEIIAQTWSEHCKHKIFNAHIDYSEADGIENPLGSFHVESLFKDIDITKIDSEQDLLKAFKEKEQ